MLPMRDGRTNDDDDEQGKIGLLSLWAVGRLSFVIITASRKKFTQAPPVVPVTNMRYARKIAMICVIHLSPPPQRIESLPPLAQPPRHENFT